jgi:hypothetical protein
LLHKYDRVGVASKYWIKASDVNVKFALGFLDCGPQKARASLGMTEGTADAELLAAETGAAVPRPYIRTIQRATK